MGWGATPQISAIKGICGGSLLDSLFIRFRQNTFQPPPQPFPLNGEGRVGVESTWHLFKKEFIQ